MAIELPIEPLHFLVVIGAIMIIPLVIDQLSQYNFTRKKIDKISSNSKDSSNSDNKHIYDISRPSPSPGLYRTLMTFGVIILVGAMLLYVLGTLANYLQPLDSTLTSLTTYLKNSNRTNNTDTEVVNLVVEHSNSAREMSMTMINIIKDVATVLGGAVSAIIGFYFGNKAATDTVPEKPTPINGQQSSTGSGQQDSTGSRQQDSTKES